MELAVLRRGVLVKFVESFRITFAQGHHLTSALPDSAVAATAAMMTQWLTLVPELVIRTQVYAQAWRNREKAAARTPTATRRAKTGATSILDFVHPSQTGENGA